ncbi:MAG: hypothetical protein ACLR23_16780 [Clostridia bacterium]
MIALYIVIGALAGVISGMGIGGGVILIPALVFRIHSPARSTGDQSFDISCRRRWQR